MRSSSARRAWSPADGAPLVLTAVAEKFTERAIASGIPESLLTDAPAHLVASPDVDIIVETMGGAEPARTLVAAALASGKSVVTANKHIVAHFGPELERARPGERRAVPVRGRGRRRHPAPRADRAGPRREPHRPRPRHRQRHDELHAHRDDPRGPRLRGGARRGPGEGLRGGRPDRGRRGSRRAQQARDPRAPRVRRVDRPRRPSATGRARRPARRACPASPASPPRTSPRCSRKAACCA